MMRLAGAALLAAIAFPAFAEDGPSDEDVTTIMAMLAEMQCEMDAGDIEKEDDGFELDDVYCADGQYDIDLDASFTVTNKRAE